MSTTTPWPIVTADAAGGIRPAGPPDQCFYCAAAVGQPHARKCSLVCKRVRVKFTYAIDVQVPHNWSPQDVAFYYGASSWCALNGLALIEAHADRAETCFCGDPDGFYAEFVKVVDETPTPRSDR